MSYLEKFFRKDGFIEKINKEDLATFTSNQTTEHIYFDYKSSPEGKPEERAKKLEEFRNDVAKDITAFANSEGGLLIIGFCEKDKKIKPISIKSETFDHQLKGTKMNPIPDFKIATVDVEENTEIKYVHLIDIPQGNKVYQAPDNKFYRRSNGQNHGPLNQQEILDVAGRSGKPNVEIELWFSIQDAAQNLFLVEIILKNTGRSIAEYPFFRLQTYSSLKPRFSPSFDGRFDDSIRFTGIYRKPDVVLYPDVEENIGFFAFTPNYDDLDLNILFCAKDQEKIEASLKLKISNINNWCFLDKLAKKTLNKLKEKYNHLE